MNSMDVREETVDAVLHYAARALLAISLIGLAVGVYALAMGWS